MKTISYRSDYRYRVLSIIVVALVFVSMITITTLTVRAYDPITNKKIGDYTYDIYDDGSGSSHYGSVWIKKYHGTDTQIVLPTSVTYNGTKYATPNFEFSVSKAVFSGNTKISKIAIPDGYDVMRGAFAGCTNLTEVAIGNNVQYIGTWDGGDGTSKVGAFSGCPNLKTYRIAGTAVSNVNDLKYSGIGQDNNGNIYPNVTVYTVKGSKVDEYIKGINQKSTNGNTIKLVYQDDPYSNHTVKPSHTHSYGSWTNLNSTQHQRKCSCGAVQKANHQWDGGKITKEATTTATGTKVYTCKVCNGTKTETIPKKTASDPDLKVKSLWASKHEVGKVTFKWTKKEGVKDTGWKLKYRMRKIGGNNAWGSWKYETRSVGYMQAVIKIPVNYVIEIHAQGIGDKTWSTGIITTPAGGTYQAMKVAHARDATTKKRVTVDQKEVEIKIKKGSTIKLEPDYIYPVADYNKRPRLYPTQMLYDVGNNSIISITHPNGKAYTGGMIDGIATIKGVKIGSTPLICRAPNGRTQKLKITVY